MCQENGLDLVFPDLGKKKGKIYSKGRTQKVWANWYTIGDAFLMFLFKFLVWVGNRVKIGDAL